MKRKDIAKTYAGYTLHPITLQNIDGYFIPCYIITDPKSKYIEAILKKNNGDEILTPFDYMGDRRRYNNINHMYETASYMAYDVGRDW